MPLDIQAFGQSLASLKPIEIPDELDRYKTLAALKMQQTQQQTAGLQQQDIQAQIEERKATAAKDALAQQKQARMAQILQDATIDPETGMPDMKSPAMQQLYREFPDVHAALSEHYAKVGSEAATAANQRSDLKVKQDTLANTQATEAFNRLTKKQEQDRKDAEEAAGTLIPGTEFTTPDQAGKPQRAAQFRVRQPDGSYKNEKQILGPEMAAPQNPPQPEAPMSDARFQQALALERQKASLNGNNSVPPLEFLTETSSTGVPFIDASKVEPKTLNALQTAAGQAGKKVVDKDTAQGLRDITTAKANQQSMMDLLNGRLPENPFSRIFAAPENKLKALGQLDPNLAITGTFVGPAIQSLRAVAGAKGFRITKSEIDNAAANFVPLATDTVDTAKAKMAALAHFMDNKERGALGTSAPPAGGFSFTYQGKTLTFPDEKSMKAAKAAAGVQ